jgi:hypothetical protein
MRGGGQCHNSVKTGIFKNSVGSLGIGMNITQLQILPNSQGPAAHPPFSSQSHTSMPCGWNGSLSMLSKASKSSGTIA